MTGEELKYYRLKAKYTQQQLGEALGYKGRSAEGMIQMWEHDRRNIGTKNIRKLSEILNVPIEKFLP